jgi:hypothetical protein
MNGQRFVRGHASSTVLECIDLALQQRRGHEMTVATGQMLAHEIPATASADGEAIDKCACSIRRGSGHITRREGGP